MTDGPRILVVGGNVAGLAAAAAIQRAGLDVTVFERMEAHPRVPGGLHIATNGLKVLHRLGVGDELVARGTPVRRARFLGVDGSSLTDIPVSSYARSAGSTTLFCRRWHLTDVLATAVTPGTVRFGTAVESYEQDRSGVTVHLADGSTERGEVLIAADGVRSCLRRQLLGDVPLRHAGYADWGAVVPFSDPRFPPGDFWTIWGRGWRVGLAHVEPGSVFWAASIPQDEPRYEPPDLGRLGEALAGWVSPVPALVAATEAQQLFGAPIFDFAPLSRWVSGRVALIGDAAHATQPAAGRGASEALESGLTFANALASLQSFREPRGVEHCLRGWAASRRPQTSAVTRLSRHMGWIGTRRSDTFVRTYLRATATVVRDKFRRDARADVPPVRPWVGQRLRARGPLGDGDDLTPIYFEWIRMGNAYELERFGELVAEDIEIHHHAKPDGVEGLDAVRAIYQNMHEAMPDLRFEPQMVMSRDDCTLSWEILSGTHLGDLNGLPPTGRTFAIPVARLMRYRDGKIVEVRFAFDAAKVPEQVAGLPAPSSVPRPVGWLLAARARRQRPVG